MNSKHHFLIILLHSEGYLCLCLSVSVYMVGIFACFWGSLPNFSVQWHHCCSLKSATVGVLTPPTLAKAPNPGSSEGRSSVFGRLVKHWAAHHCRHTRLKHGRPCKCSVGKVTPCFQTLVFCFLRVLWGLHKPHRVKAVVPLPGCTSESLQTAERFSGPKARGNLLGWRPGACTSRLPRMRACRPAFGNKLLEPPVEKIMSRFLD